MNMIFSGFEKESNINFFGSAQWLRPAVSGANSGFVTVISLMIGIGATTDGITAMIIAGVISLIIGACIMAVGELDSVSTRHDVGTLKIRRDKNGGIELEAGIMENLPNPRQSALASGLAFAAGAVVSVLAVAITRRKHHIIRMIVIALMVSLALLGIGSISWKTYYAFHVVM